MVITELWYVQFKDATDTTGVSETLGSYPTPEEAKEAIHKKQRTNPNSIFYLAKITVDKTLVETFFLPLDKPKDM